MPGGLPLGLEICNLLEYGSANGGSNVSPGTLVTASATPNTKGAWTQIVASTTADICELFIQLVNFGVGQDAVDIGIGPSGQEIVIAGNLLVNTTPEGIAPFLIPCQIKEGTRIAARCQSTTASDQVSINVTGADGAFTMMDGSGGVDSIGFSTTTGLGTSVTASATPAVKGAYSQIISSTARDYIGICAAFDNAGGSPSDVILLDISIGSSGNEKVIVPDIVMNFDAPTPIFTPTTLLFLAVPVPAGSRIAARSSGIFVGSQTVGVTVYGVWQ